MPRVVLASRSSRRRHILEQLRIEFEVVHPSYEEDMDQPLAPAALARSIALEKAMAVAETLAGDAVVVSADTFVRFEGGLLGKPKSPRDATDMLTQLRAKPVQVITGFAVLDTATGRHTTGAETVDVLMHDYTDSEIRNYVRSGEPAGVAGAFNALGLGALMVERIEGDLTALAGLPARPVANALREYDVTVL